MEYKNNKQNNFLLFKIIALLAQLFGLKFKKAKDKVSKEALKKDFKNRFAEIIKASPERLEAIRDEIKGQLKANKGVNLKRLDELFEQKKQVGKAGKTISEVFIVDEKDSTEKTQSNLKRLMFSMPKKGVGSVVVPIVTNPSKEGGIGHIFYAIVDKNEDEMLSVSIIDSHGNSKRAQNLKLLFNCLTNDVEINKIKFQQTGRNDCGAFTLSGVETFMDSELNGRNFMGITEKIADKETLTSEEQTASEKFNSSYSNLTEKEVKIERSEERKAGQSNPIERSCAAEEKRRRENGTNYTGMVR